MRVPDNAQARGTETNADKALIDPATGRPVVRDLRFHRFVAHQREFYLLKQRGDQ